MRQSHSPQTQKRPGEGKERKRKALGISRRLRPDPRLATLLSSMLFTLSVAGWEGDPLGGPLAPANSAAASPLLGFNIYLWG